ncbi:unnamed protein product [Acanthoscelides obtectus]|uniref:Uncharacterized protein n=1 Tax=Acanthoscelides obtectus TaxID=200917 RepID=A0A9P0PWG8_ACAOB|nr:unnamed protein product [Acanthoscelides obtectus]CAK1651515.1 Odorant receptor 47b [Acanthoscelides obtectus]
MEILLNISYGATNVLPLNFAIQVLIVYVFLMPAGQICFMFYESVMLIVTHIHHLEDHLKLLFREPDVQRRIVSLRNCVSYHAHIIRMADQLNRLLKTFAGHMSAVWAICFGCIGNQIFKSKPLGAALYLGGYMIALSFFVEAGQSLLSESETIADEIYKIDWHLGTVEEQKNVMFMLAKAQKPLTLSAEPFGNYQYSLFVLIVKTAYSYLTLLQQST